MKLATTTGDFHRHTGSHAESLRLIRKSGFHYADMNFGTDYAERSGIYSDDFERYFDETNNVCAKIGIELVQAHAPMGRPIADGNEQFIADTIRCVDACGAWGIPNLVIHSGYLPDISKEECFAKNKEFYAPILDVAEKYDFKVQIEYFTPDPSSAPVRCSVVSDRGKWLRTFEGEDLSQMEFSLDDSNASYFYLRFVDGLGRKTWSPPIWTGREPKSYSVPSIPLPKEGWTAMDILSGEDASEVICNDVTRVWKAVGNTASVVIDMKKEHTVTAVGHYAPFIDRFELMNEKIPLSCVMGAMAAEYVISTSIDGESFEERDRGFVRIYGGEEILPFEPCVARYVKVDFLSNTATASDQKDLAYLPLTVAELSIF
jgi:hypothetical protein